jgi:hypothetical protein
MTAVSTLPAVSPRSRASPRSAGAPFGAGSAGRRGPVGRRWPDRCAHEQRERIEGWLHDDRDALIARAGLDVPWRVTIEHPDGFDEDITIGVTARYFDIFETQGFHPSPDMETGDGNLVYLTFTAPAGSIFSADFDAYIQPSSQLSERADVVLMVDDRPLMSVSYTTWLVP